MAGLDREIIRLVQITGHRADEIKRTKQTGGPEWERLQGMVSWHERMLRMGETHSRQKAIQDPVHGAIILSPWELDVISTWEMLRLRYVKQLGPAHIVYPGATHTRFEHCLGTNFLAQKCIAVVNYCDELEKPCFRPLSELMDDYHQKIFRASALLHDVGHPPTSHTIEFALRSWCGLDHTDLGEYLILHSGVKDALEKNSIEPTKVVEVIKRRSRDPILMLISDFIDSPLDIDKTDYLIRDAHFSGVQLGIFPAERVLLTNRVVKDESGRWVRAFMIKAIHSLESLVLSRNWMFSDLYIHHAVRVAEALTSKATYFRLKEEKMSKEECVGFFTRMTDGDLYRWLEASETDFVREYAARIRYRRLYKVVLSKPISSFEADAQKRIAGIQENAETLVETERELMGDYSSVIIDVVDPELGDRTLGRMPMLVGTEGTGYRLVEFKDTLEGRPVIMTLKQQKKIIPTVRVYADPSIAEDVQRRFDRMFPSTNPGHFGIEDDHGEF